MATLPDFENDARDALLDKAENALYAEPDNITYQFLRCANNNFEEYANRHDYDIHDIPASGHVTDTTRTTNSVSSTVLWDHPLTGIYEYGAQPHTIEGNPILSFVWSDPPQWVKEKFPQGRDASGRFVSGWRVYFSSVNHPGVPESRSIRGALQLLRLQLEGRVSL